MEIAMANEAVTTAAGTLATGGEGVFFGLNIRELLALIIAGYLGWMAYSVHKGNKNSDQSETLGKLMGHIEGLEKSIKAVDVKVERSTAELKEYFKESIKVVDEKVDRVDDKVDSSTAELKEYFKESIKVVDDKVDRSVDELKGLIKVVDGKVEKSMADSTAVHSEIKDNITAAEKRLREDIQNLRADNRATNEKIDAILLSMSGVKPMEG